MNFKITLLATFLFLFSCSSNNKEEIFSNLENSVFPDSWTGEYEGNLYINKNGLAMDTNVMKLKVHRIDINRTAFHIKYQSDSNWREYEIKPGKTNSHWIMDEKNSILLDHYFQNNEFSSVFSVNESMLKANYRKQGDTITSTITTYPLQYVKETGDSVPYIIKSYKEQLVQRAVLIRKR